MAIAGEDAGVSQSVGKARPGARTRKTEVETPVANTAALAELMSAPLFPRQSWRRLTEKHSLSPRQLQIARMICCAAEDKHIAQALGITLFGVREHLRRLFEKLEVDSRLALVVRLVRSERELSARAAAQSSRGRLGRAVSQPGQARKRD